METGLIIRDLSKVYHNPYTGEDVVSIEDVSLHISPGEFTAILGPSGCGKTTLLNIVAGFLPPTRGEVLLNGRRIKGPGPDRGVVFQSFALFPWKTVLENVAFGLKMRGVSRAERESIAREYIALVGLQGFEYHYPHELSGGMQQRVGVARVLANQPDLMLMDEPFASVDAQTRMTLQEELARIWEARRPTVLFVTHDVEEAVFLANRVVVLTARPARVQATLEIPLPRPRIWQQLIDEPGYKSQVARILALVRDSQSAQNEGNSLPLLSVGARGDGFRSQEHGDTDVGARYTGTRAILRRLGSSGLARVLATATVVTMTWQGWLDFQAASKISMDMQLRMSRQRRVDLLVLLPFPPERFHILTFQKFGRVSGTRDSAVEVRAVPSQRVRAIARLYWVREIRPLEAP